MKTIQLMGCIGCGSAMVEAALILTKTPFTYIEANYDEPSGLEALKKVNPLGQVPVLILPEGKILTESAAIINYIHLNSSDSQLVPLDTENNVLYWRWISFLIGSIYASFTYGDFPERWVSKEAAASLKASTDERRKALWLQVEAEIQGEYFLSEFSALDLYLAVMANWRPGRDWFRQNCPKIFGVSERLLKHPELISLWKKHKMI